MPNHKVAQSVIINYDLPESRMALFLPVSVAYASDPDAVEAALVDEATGAAGEVARLLAEPKPFVRFNPGFAESSLGFTLVCYVATYPDQFAVQHELRKRILRRFRQDGIEIPFPVRTIELRHSSPDGQSPPP